MLLAPGRQISSLLPTSGSRTTLTWIPLCRFFLVASSLSSLLCCLFFVASLGAFFSAFYWSPSFLLCGELDCWLTWWHTEGSRSSSSQYSDQYWWWGWRLSCPSSSLYLWIWQSFTDLMSRSQCSPTMPSFQLLLIKAVRRLFTWDLRLPAESLIVPELF